MTTLTTNEITAMKVCLNYDNRKDQLNDNYSNGGPAEFMDALGWNAQQVGGLMTSLTEKGMGYCEDNSNTVWLGPPPPVTFWLTEAGVNTIFDIIEQEEAQVTEDYFTTTDDAWEWHIEAQEVAA